MKRVLVVNDDGYQSSGLIALARRLGQTYGVTVVAPSSERSWIGKAVSAHTSVQAARTVREGIVTYVVEGTPADCAQLGIYGLMDERPDFVVSGVNIGDNVGRARTLSSGTIGGAIEGALAGVPAVAASLCGVRGRGIDYFSSSAEQHFETAAEVVARTLAMIEDHPLPDQVGMVAINVPFEATTDTMVDVVAPYSGGYGSLFALDGERWRHVGAPLVFDDVQEGTDVSAIAKGHIALTPIDLRLVDQCGLQYLQGVVESARHW